MIAILAGHAVNMATGMHTATTGVIGDLCLAIANDVSAAKIEEFSSARQKTERHRGVAFLPYGLAVIQRNQPISDPIISRKVRATRRARRRL